MFHYDIFQYLYNSQVSKFQFAKNGKNNFKGKLPVPIQEHTKCKCDCRVKSEDCTKLQQYDQTQCRCNCVNMDDRAKCYAVSLTRVVTQIASRNSSLSQIYLGETYLYFNKFAGKQHENMGCEHLQLPMSRHRRVHDWHILR